MIIATPTVLTGPHPLIASAIYLVNALRPKLKFTAIVGSYGWGSRTVDILRNSMGNLKADLLEPVLIKSMPRKEALKAMDRLAEEILKKHREIGII